MKRISSLLLVFKALRQLGPDQLGLYALYQLGLRTGHYQRQLNSALARLESIGRRTDLQLHPCLPGLPDREFMLILLGDQIKQLYLQADEIVSDKVRLFGGQPVPLVLTPPKALMDWTSYERGSNQVDHKDIKFIWEPGRFGWACTLAMAYHLSNDERYAESFWINTELFLTSNPAYFGFHWSSAQEVAIRLVALTFALQVFIHSNMATLERLEMVAGAIAVHAERIPPTLAYARSQNNNHLVTEAVGLYTASALLPDHPFAGRWYKLGWSWLLHALMTQIDSDGTYTQHSTNYHRLMLQAALWVFAVHDGSFSDRSIPSAVTVKLQNATRWLWKLVDPGTGNVPNLGHNDGAYILPLTVCPQYDYRPVVSAAANKFLHTNLFTKGAWSDMGYWLCSSPDAAHQEVGFNHWHEAITPELSATQSPYTLLNRKNNSWVYLRVATFHARPAHADQLHFDLWWKGLNLAQDAGTYLYNSPPPWENSLTSALVHNSVMVDGREYMLRAGRFLYLDWAQARVTATQIASDGTPTGLTAQHDGYRKIDVVHTRKISLLDNDNWEVIDKIDGPPGSVHSARLHWLLPDWEHEIEDLSRKTGLPSYKISLLSPYGWVILQVRLTSPLANHRVYNTPIFQLVRAGTLLYGSGSTLPIAGWTSPTYGDKIPALASIFEITQSLPITIKSEWILPGET